jgi:uncharacterized protein (TIGR02145 family)
MNKLKHLLIIILLLHEITAYSQKVSNIAFRQEQSNIIVSYDLETKTPCKVSLYVSTNGGATWKGPLIKVTGDVGNEITSGSRIITWNVLDEFQELKGENIKFQLRALGNNIGTVKNVIETIMIGTQEWTTKNLNVSRYRNGDIIPEVRNQKEWDKLTTGAWCYFNNDPKNGAIYGKLYNWYAVNDPRGLAPKGFHIPSDSEWQILIDYLGGKKIVGGRIKKTSILYPDWSTFDNDFSGLPGGFRNFGFIDDWEGDRYFGGFGGIGKGTVWWTSSEDANSIHVYSQSNEVDLSLSRWKMGYSVRCIRD